jgi:raffinose/stachyose/melibiose transport system permease protein
MKARIAKMLPSAVLILPLTFVLGPFVWLLISSLKTNAEIATGLPYALPKVWRWTNYLEAWQIGGFGQLMLNSFINAAGVVTLTLLVTVPAGYAFARMRFRGSEVLFYLILFGLTIPIQAIILPVYQVLAGLGLINALLGVILAQAGNAVPFGLFIMRNFFRTMSNELVDAARIDGCGHFRIFISVLLPLATPALLALTIISALTTWNDFFLPLVVLISPEVQTIPLGLVRFASTFAADQRLIFAGTVISFFPIVALYLITQRYFVEGLTRGALKG